MGPTKQIEKPDYRPGARFGLIELVSLRASGLGQISRRAIESGVGWWTAVCRGIDGVSCGAQLSVHTRDIRRGARCAYSCLDCPGPPRKKSDRVRSPALHHAGQVYGRFYVRQWDRSFGWIAECLTCGGVQYFRKSQKMVLSGASKCNGTCEHDYQKSEPIPKSETA